MLEYSVVSFLSNSPRSFRRSSWPLHVTLVGLFHSETPPEQLADKLMIVAFRHKKLSATGMERAYFGRKRDIPVTELSYSNEFKALHLDLIATLGHAIELHSPAFNGEHFSPHVSDQRNGQIAQGQSVTIDSISLVHFSDKDARVLSNVPLN